MSDMIRTLLSRAPRYQIKDQARIAATVESRGESPEPVTVELLDISSGGAKLRTTRSFNPRQMVDVVITCLATGRSVRVVGEIRWANPTSNDCWLLGCSFTPSAPPDFLQDCAESGALERRKWPRQPISLFGIARWELGNSTESVRVVDYSAGGGFCLISPNEDKPGDRVLVQLTNDGEREVTVRGKACWQRKSDEGIAIGCEFLGAEDSAAFTELVQAQVSPTAPSKRYGRWLPWRRLPTAPDNAETHERSACAAGRRCLILAVCCAAALGLISRCFRPAVAIRRPPAASTSPSPATAESTTLPTTVSLVEKAGELARQEYRAGLVHYRAREYEQAARRFEAASLQDPTRPVYLYCLAVAHYQLKDLETAEQTLARGLALDASRWTDADASPSVHYRDPAQEWFETTGRRLRRERATQDH